MMHSKSRHSSAHGNEERSIRHRHADNERPCHRVVKREHERNRTRSPSPRDHKEHRIRVKQENEDRRDDLKRRRVHEKRRRESGSPLPSGGQKCPWGKPEPEQDSSGSKATGANAVQPKEKPTFELSGKLAADTNTYKGVVIKYNEPPEARKPRLRWRLYPFKGDEVLPVMYIHRQSAFLIGRERRVVDIPVDHPSCSKQHAVLQYRVVPYERPDGSKGKTIKPYIIDLGSANGTYLNSQRVEAQRYLELREKDVLKFGFSTREYVLLNEKSEDVVNDSNHKNSSPSGESDQEDGESGAN